MATLEQGVLTFLFNALWQVTLVAALAALGARLLRTGPARNRHWLWVMALALGFLLPLWSVWRSTRDAGAQQVAALRVGSSKVSQSPRRAAQGTALDRSSPTGSFEATSLAARGSLESAPPMARPWGKGLLLGPGSRVALPPWLGYPVLGCYLLFLLYRSSRLWNAWRKSSEVRAHAYAGPIPEPAATVWARCRSAFSLERVSLFSSPHVAGPLTLGARKPVIVLPEQVSHSTSPDELTSAFCHELAHIRRRDYLMNLICELVGLPTSFHPAARLIKRRIDSTREVACDEIAARQLASPAAYARSLVTLARVISASNLNSRPGYTLGVFDADILEERVMSLLDRTPRLNARRAKFSLLAASLVLAASSIAASAFWVRIDQLPKAQKTSSPSEETPAAPTTGVVGGVPGGIKGGIIGGVGVVGGVPGGADGGIVGGPSDGAQTAQNMGSATFSGTVSDPSGARVPDAIVSVVNARTGEERAVPVDDAGEFYFTALPPDSYQLTVRASEFEPFKRTIKLTMRRLAGYEGKKFALSAGASYPPIEIVLEPSRLIQTVEVTAEAPPPLPGTPSGSPPRRIRVGGLVQATKLVESTKPEYPESARAKGIQGVVLLRAVISKEGVPLTLNILSSPDPQLSKAATEAVVKWRYDPTLLNGEPIEVVTTIAVRFRLTK